MTKITAHYLGDLRCEMTHQDSGEKLITDAPKDNQGKGEFFSPTDLFATSLGTCMLTIMGIQAKALKADLSGTRIEVDKQMAPDSPRRISKVSVHFFLPDGIDEKTQARLIRAAESCPVHHSMSPEIEQDIQYHWGSL